MMRQKEGKSTIFRIFLIPLITIMLIQSIITIGTLVVRRTISMLEGYSSGMMSRLVENRKVILQSDMIQRWGSIYEQEVPMNRILEQFLQSEGVKPEELFASDDMRNRLLELFFPECLNLVEEDSTTGIFFIFTGNDLQSEGDFDGFYIRDSDPNMNPANYTDLLLERGSKQLSRKWEIPLDTNWTTRFHMDGRGKTASDNYFYEPWSAGQEHMYAGTKDLGYWSPLFSLEKNTADAYEMITYSLPLRYDGRVYGVLGVEISARFLHNYFPVAELNSSQQSGYMLAIRRKDDSYVPMVGKGILYNQVHSVSNFILQETAYDNLSLIQGADLEGQRIYAVEGQLKLYSNNVPYEDTEWVLLGLNTENDIFGMSRQIYVWIVVSILAGLIFGVAGIYLLVNHLTKPVQRLIQCISRGQAGLREFKLSNILEIDTLYDVVTKLMNRQKETENILLEEKERYKLALESSTDIYYSYDFKNKILDIVNHKTMSGQWLCEGFDSNFSFIKADYIYEADREAAIKSMRENIDNLYVEFRIKWPAEMEFNWVAVTGKVLNDADGQRWKLIGSIRDIQESKEREEEQLRKNTIDGVTGFYVFSVGMKTIREYRKTRPEGVMIVLLADRLKESREKNGIVFGDMILEEIGDIIRAACQEITKETGWRVVATCLNREEIVLWLENQSRQWAKGFTESLLKKAQASFGDEIFSIRLYAGLACAEQTQSAEQLIRMAKLAQNIAAAGTRDPFVFYEDIHENQRSWLPSMQEYELNTQSYGREVGLVSVALNLFGRGSEFLAQMTLMIRKIGRFYQATDVLLSLLRADFNSNYLNYQWHQDGGDAAESVRKYNEEEKGLFYDWLGKEEVLHFSEEDSRQKMLQSFLSIEAGQRGIALPLYDSGSYMGSLCILGVGPELLENPEEYQNLAELGRVIQSQLVQQQHDVASRAKSEFLSRMSHEIRTPMNGIIGMTTIALQANQSQERMTDCLQKIQASSNYLLGLINDILDMSKIESGKMRLEPRNFNIYEMLDTIKELITSQAEAKNIDFVQNIELNHAWFVADQLRISQVLINLLGNAVKFTPENGKIILTVRETSSSNGKAEVYFSVLDTGIGIAKDNQERVFRSFEQAVDINPSKHRGTGLGLSISSRLVQLMESSIRLDSAPGEGSTFSFSILLDIGENVATEETKEELSFDGCRILVVEDNELNAEIAQCLLTERNFQVDCVHDGAQAVERIRTTEPGTYDIILMDIMMPVMDGLEATRLIRSMEREDCRTVPIIAMSANAFDEDLKKSVECGMDGHLSKPVEVDKLYRTLGEVMKGRRKD